MLYGKETNIKIKLKHSLIVLLALCLSLNFIPVKAQDTSLDDLNAQKAANQAKLNQLNQQIKQYQQQITSTQKSANTLQNAIAVYDKQIASTQLAIEAKQTQIDDTNIQIKQLQKAIEQKNNDLQQNRQILSELLVQMNEYDNEYTLQTTIGSDSLSDFLDQIQYTKDFQDKIYQLVQKIKEIKSQLEQQQAELKIQVKTLGEEQAALQQTQDSLSEQRSEKQQLLTQTRGLESNYQKLLSTSKQEQDNLQKEVDDLDAKIRAKLGNKSAPGAPGVLAWPVDGVLTQGYGNTGFTSLGYNFHNGIDIAGPAGSPVSAAADGVVYDTDHSNVSFGNWVAIKHNITSSKGSSQIITLYGHLRTILVTPGQAVKQGDLIGYEGNTGNTTAKIYGPERGYHVHFGVYDIDGFGVQTGAYTKIYGPYKIPYGYTYNPLDFLPSQ